MPSDVVVEIQDTSLVVEVSDPAASVVEVALASPDGLTFNQIRLADALSPTPEDPNSIFNSVTEDAAGWDVEIQGISVDAMPEGCWWRFNLPATWRGDGTQALLFRYTEVTAGDDNWWIMAGTMDQAGLAAGSPDAIGGGVRYQIPTNIHVVVANSSFDVFTSLGAPPLTVAYALIVPWGTDAAGQLGNGTAWGEAGDSQYAGATAGQTIMPAGTKQMVLAFGTSEDTTLGAVSAKVKAEVAVIELLPSGSLP